MEEILDRKVIKIGIEAILWKLLAHYTKKEIEEKAHLTPSFIYKNIGKTGKDIRIKTGVKIGEHEHLFKELKRLISARERILTGEYKRASKRKDNRKRDKAERLPTGMSNIEFLVATHKNSFATKKWC